MNDLHFTSQSKKYQVILRSSAHLSMLDLSIKSKRLETGGVLIGYYSDELDTAIVTQISHVPDDSQQSMFGFIRGIKGLVNLFQSLWNFRRHYLGEWHFHPYSSPNPSSDDLEAIKEISVNKNYQCSAPIMLILGGDPNGEHTFRLFVQPKGERLQELKTQND